MDVAAWLQSLGLERYVPAFRDNDIDAEVLPKLTADDLISIGVTSVGYRRKLLAAIAALSAEMPAAVTAPSRNAPAQAEAERRQLTVMFCDLVGSTALAARLDPEDLREVIAAYHRAVAEIVAGFDGFVAKYMGDGVLIYFGYPRAHEDDPERAVLAGLAIQHAIEELNDTFGPSSMGPDTTMRGPSSLCAATSRRARSTGSRSLPMSRMPVTPFAMNSGITHSSPKSRPQPK